mgnify:CR=1 FL=1
MRKSIFGNYIFNKSEAKLLRIAVDYLEHRILKHDKPDRWGAFISYPKLDKFIEKIREII